MVTHVQARHIYADRYLHRNLPFSSNIHEHSPVFRKLSRLGHMFIWTFLFEINQRIALLSMATYLTNTLYNYRQMYRVLVKYVAILNRAILWFTSSKKVHTNICPKRLSFRNTGECSQMFNKTVNCVGDISLHKYALLHVSYHSHNRKQSVKVKVKAF